MKKAFVETYHISKIFNAPLGFVYKWCTDFRKDDPKMIGSRSRRNIIERSRRRVVWTVAGKDAGTGYSGVRVVWLKPPNAWHLDTCGDKSEQGDYRLRRLGKATTRLDMKFTVTYANAGEVESRESWEADVMSNWDAYGRHFEKDYRQYLRAK